MSVHGGHVTLWPPLGKRKNNISRKPLLPGEAVLSRYFVNHYGELVHRPDDQPVTERHGVHCALWHDDAVLLVRAPRANWLELPGGGIERGESIEVALQRELREEAGVELPTGYVDGSDRIQFQSHYFATGHQAYWRYQQTFCLIRVERPPALGEPTEAGHERIWLRLMDLHRERIHHVHRAGLDQLLKLMR